MWFSIHRKLSISEDSLLNRSTLDDSGACYKEIILSKLVMVTGDILFIGQKNGREGQRTDQSGTRKIYRISTNYFLECHPPPPKKN